MDIDTMIELFAKMRHGWSPDLCLIAKGEKENTGLEIKVAPNRIEIDVRSDICPPHKFHHVMDALKHFEFIK